MLSKVTKLRNYLPMQKSLLVATALLLQLSALSLTAQALPEEKAVGKAATYYRHLDLATNSSKNSASKQVAQDTKKPAPEAQVAVQQQVQSPVVNFQPETSKVESTQASTAK
jgi:hypothetical protein